MSIELPIVALQTRQVEGRQEVWDGIRRKWLVLTPEEHVRQCLIVYLVDVLRVPKGLISLERGIRYNTRQKRYDLLVYGRDGQPLILCECKSPRVDLGDATLFQWGVYHKELNAKALLLTNGKILMAAAPDANAEWKHLHLPLHPGGEGWNMDCEDWIFLPGQH